MSAIPRIALSVALVLLLWLTDFRTASANTYKMIESTFSPRGVTGNPFDYMQNDIRVTFTTPEGKTDIVPAFYDGGSTWRVRYTPKSKGKYSITRIERNGSVAKGAVAAPDTFGVTGGQQPGFIRISAVNRLRFAFDNGNSYFPLGNDVAWRADGPNADVTDFFDRMGAVGENWSRVWMCHWDGKNLDWPPPKEGAGYLNLTAARRWDSIVESADKNGIYFQMTLQHHGQYSTMVDPNWSENPWSKKKWRLSRHSGTVLYG